MTLLAVRHVTIYHYRQPVSFGEHRIMFRPRDSYDQRLLDSRIEINPAPSGLRWIHDVFGNCVAIAKFAKEASELRFESDIRLDHQPSNAPDSQMEDYAQTYPFAYSAEEMPDLMRTMERQYLDPDHQIHHWVQKFIHQGRPTRTGELLMTLTYAIKESFTYNRRSEAGVQDPITTLMLKRGSCRDFAILMIEAVRALGLAARFVSGYIYSPGSNGTSHVGGGSTHAWCQVYLPGAGWVEFDPTNGIIGNRDLIRIAVAQDPRQAVPISGTWMGETSDFEGMTVEVNVTSSESMPAQRTDSTSPDSEYWLPNPEGTR